MDNLIYIESGRIHNLQMSKKVFLWATPRSLSTAFARAILNLEDCKVFIEAYYYPYFFGPNRNNQRYAQTPIDPDVTYANTAKSIDEYYEGKRHVFCKEMAFYFDGRLAELEGEKLKDFQHAFLIRDPKKSIPSFYRAVSGSRDPFWHDFDPNECGFRQQYELFEFVRNRSGATPLVIDSDDLLKNPEEVLKYFCGHTGLTYKEGMTMWEPGYVPELNGWAEDFHSDLMESSGIGRKAKQDPSKVDHSSQTVCPKIVEKAIEDSEWFYQQLYQHRLYSQL